MLLLPPTHCRNVILLGRTMSFPLSADWRQLTSFSSTAHWLFFCLVSVPLSFLPLLLSPPFLALALLLRFLLCSRCILRVCSKFWRCLWQHFSKFLILKYMAGSISRLMCMCPPLSLSSFHFPALSALHNTLSPARRLSLSLCLSLYLSYFFLPFEGVPRTFCWSLCQLAPCAYCILETDSYFLFSFKGYFRFLQYYAATVSVLYGLLYLPH